MIVRSLTILLLLTSVARAQAVHASYSAYAAGLNVINMDADFSVLPEQYRIHLAYHSVGTFSLVVRTQQDTVVEGRFVRDHAVPSRFFSQGVLRGQPRVTQIDYPGGQPSVRQLVPPNDAERETVAPAQQANTIDTISAMAELVHRVNATGRCEGQAMTFDGRRLTDLHAQTTATEVLEPTSRSSFSGPALRCDFTGRQLGGYKLGEDREHLKRPQYGTAWFAALQPGGPKIPVRISFHTEFFGQATMYLRDTPAP